MIRPVCPWTEEQVATLRRMRAEGKSCVVIARALDIARDTVRKKLNKLGINAKSARATPENAWTREQDELLRELWLSDVASSVIAEEVGRGVGKAAIIARAYKLGLPKRRRPPVPRQKKAARPVAVVVAVEPLLISLLELNDPTFTRQCRYPYGEGTAIRFCGHPMGDDGDRPYCAYHANLAYSNPAMRHAARDSVKRPSFFARAA